MTDVDAKLDKIIALLEKKTPSEDVKQEIIDFMMKHFNLVWVDDKIEESAYHALLDFIFDKIL